MAKYLIESMHTPEECLQALDQMALRPHDLSKFEWGCKSGDHRGFAFVDAKSDAEALNVIPASFRSKAKAIKMDKFTQKDLQAIHKEMATANR